jgi:hypothetical protein
MPPPASPPRAVDDGLSGRLQRLPHRGRRPEDTAAGCRGLAAASMAQAALAPIANGRSRYEHSAATWTKRADLLARIEASHGARVAAPGGAATQ